MIPKTIANRDPSVMLNESKSPVHVVLVTCDLLCTRIFSFRHFEWREDPGYEFVSSVVFERRN